MNELEDFFESVRESGLNGFLHVKPKGYLMEVMPPMQSKDRVRGVGATAVEAIQDCIKNLDQRIGETDGDPWHHRRDSITIHPIPEFGSQPAESMTRDLSEEEMNKMLKDIGKQT